MKPFLEKVVTADDASWSMLNRRLDEGIPFEWHHHPEFELTLTLNSKGQRFVGDHIGAYADGDLVLLGPNLPHTWSSTGRIDAGLPHIALVMWFKPEWAAGLTSVLTELRPVAAMLASAGRGLKFPDHSIRAVQPLIEALFEKPPAERLIALIEVLTRLARDMEAEPLASPARAGIPAARADGGRIDRVLGHIHANYATDISVPVLADIAALSPSGFHRLFRRHTRLTFTEYVARLRVGEACALLSGSDRPVAHIAESVGYNSLANFNRQFKTLKGLTPREYRHRFAPRASRHAAP
jgi:AraC-like DNA-binding protein